MHLQVVTSRRSDHMMPGTDLLRLLLFHNAGLISPEILRGGIEDMIYVGLGNFAFFPCQIASMVGMVVALLDISVHDLLLR